MFQRKVNKIETIKVPALSPTADKDIFISLKNLRSKYPKSTNALIKVKSESELLNSFDVSSPLLNHQIHQELISDRLSKGRVQQGSKFSKLETILSDSKAKELDSVNYELEEASLQAYLSNIRILKELKNDLFLNFQVSRSKKLWNHININGLVYTLQDKLILNSNEGPFDFSNFSKELSSLNEPIRELIRLFLSRDLNNGAELLELLWKLIIKLLDNAAYSHFFNLSLQTDKAQADSRSIFLKKEQEISLLKDNHNKILAKITQENKELKESLKDFKIKADILKNNLKEKNDEFNILYEHGNRLNDMKDLKKLLVGFDSFIMDTENEQRKQINTLQSIANLIDSTKSLAEGVKISCKATQTENKELAEFSLWLKYSEFIKKFEKTFAGEGLDDYFIGFIAYLKNIEEKKIIIKN